MNSKIVVTTIAVLLCLGLFSACVDEKEDNSNMVTVKFDTGEGSKVPSVKIPKGKSLESENKVPANPVYEGFDFGGWYDISDPYEDMWRWDNTINNNITLKAIWWPIDPNNGDITFDPANGTNTVTRYCTVGSKIPRFPEDPVWVGYIFQGWFDAGDNEYTSETIVSVVRITLTAKWTIDPSVKMITIKFNPDGGFPSSYQDVIIPQGSTMGEKYPANPVKGVFIFLGWFYNDFKYTAATPIYDDMTLKARWVTYGQQQDGTWLIDHSKFFGYYGANFVDGDTIIFSERYGGKEFNVSDMGGKEKAAEYKHLVIYFNIIPNQDVSPNNNFSISFASNPGNIDHQYTSFTSAGNNILVISEANFTKFKNEINKETAPGTMMILKQNNANPNSFGMKISSMFMTNTIPSVTATFDPDNGSEIFTRTAVNGVSISSGPTIGSANFPANPVKSGYNFVRWYNPQSGATITSSSTIGNIDVKAEWVEILTVTFKDGEKTIATETVNKGSSLGAKFPQNPTGGDGLQFLGWYDEDDTAFQNVYLSTTPIMKSLTLIARWLSTDDIVTVVFDSAGGNNINSVQLQKGESLGNKYIIPVKPNFDYHNYIFIGWFDETEEPPKQYLANTPITESLTLTAHWQEVAPHIVAAGKVEVNEGTEDDPVIIEYGGTLFNFVGNWSSIPDNPGVSNMTAPFLYNDQYWWVIAAVHTAAAGWADKTADFPQNVFDDIKTWHATGYTRIAFPFPGEASEFSKVTVFYDMVHISGPSSSSSQLSIQLRTDPNAAGGSGIAANYTPEETLIPGTDKTFTRDKAAFTQNVMAIVKQANANQMLVRFTKIIFHN